MEDNYDQLFDNHISWELEKHQLKGVTNEQLFEDINGFVSEDGEGLNEYLPSDNITWSRITEQYNNGKISNHYREWLENCHIYLFAK